ncbi:MAG: CoA transferase [Hyphomicrobiales bacterium]|nr:CoA transferase [Hyphomicrobiales bacterium]
MTAQIGDKPVPACALAGVRVLELSYFAAAVAGRTLSSLGAEVIKIEPPGGELARLRSPCARLEDGSQLSYDWLAFNVGKRSVCIDLDTEQGLAAFSRLTASADIVVSDFQRLSIEESNRLAAIARSANPKMIWTEILPFGRGEPYQSYPATDTILQALGGHLFLNGDIDRPPVRIGVPVALVQGGVEAASAALMAYYHVVRGGPGQRVDISIQECIVWTLLNTTMAWQILGLTEMRGGAVRKERANRFYTRLVWHCLDGYVFFGPVGGGGGAAREKSYAALLKWMREDGFEDEILTRHEWNGDKQFDIPQEDYDAVTAVISRFISSKSTERLMTRAVAERILLAPISAIRDVFENEHFCKRGFYELIDDQTRGLTLAYPARWANLSATPLSPLLPSPSPGQDNDLLLERVETRTA